MFAKALFVFTEKKEAKDNVRRKYPLQNVERVEHSPIIHSHSQVSIKGLVRGVTLPYF